MIEQMDQRDVEEESEELQPFIEFERSDTGRFQFACVHGEMDCRVTQRNGLRAVEFTWDGNDETEQQLFFEQTRSPGQELDRSVTRSWPRCCPRSRTDPQAPDTKGEVR